MKNSEKEIKEKPKIFKSLFLKSFLLLFLPIIVAIPFFYLTYPLRPHCSLGKGLLGCTPMCEPISYFEDGRPAGYKVIPCYHEDPSEFQKTLFNNWFLMPLVLFIILTLWVYKEGGKKVIKRLKYIALAPVYIFKENRQNKHFLSRLAVILISFFLFAEWTLGYYVAETTLLGKEPFNFPLPPPQSNQMVSNLPSFTGQDVFNAVNKYRKENNVPELKLDEVLCNNLAQRYLDIKSGEKENIAHKGFDEWYEKYVKPYGYTISENYACGQTPEDIIKAWDGSPGHKLSILDKKNKLACTYATEGCAVIVLGYKTSPQVKGAQTNIGNDPIVDCQISPECGGGSRQMKSSECDQMTCCLIHEKCGGGARFITKTECSNLYCCFLKDGTGKLMSKNECDHYYDSQNKQLDNLPNSSQTNKVPVFLTSGKYTIYCPPKNVDAVKSIDETIVNKSQEWSKNYNDCTNNFYKTDSCHVSCKDAYDKDISTCTSTYGFTGDDYNKCTENVLNNYKVCIGNCPSVAPVCEYVYSELKNLSSQISELCK